MIMGQKTISFQEEYNFVELLDLIAKERERSRTYIIQNALRYWLKQEYPERFKELEEKLDSWRKEHESTV